ncbi:GUN4 domain-containing protein, partial [Aetokthonos hydrillicola]
KAQRRISVGVFVLIIAVLGAATVGVLSKNKLDETKEEVKAVQQLNKLAGKLQSQRDNSENNTFDYNEALRLSALSFNIDNHKLKQALVFAAISQAYQQLKNTPKAEEQYQQNQKFLKEADQKDLDSKQGLQIQVLSYKFQGSLLAQKKETEQKAIEDYRQAFEILISHKDETDFTKQNQLLTPENIESVHRELINLLNKDNTKQQLRQQVAESLTQHLYAQLEYYLNDKKWAEADSQTDRLMVNIAKRDKKGYLDYDDIKSFSCPALRRIDQLWVNSDKRFGFSVQKEIWIKTGNRLGIKLEQWNGEDYKNYIRFSQAVGWLDDKGRENESGSMSVLEFKSYDELLTRINRNPYKYRGSLPYRLMKFRIDSYMIF